MSRPLLLALLLAAALAPAPSRAQGQDGQSSYGGFLYNLTGQDEGKEKPAIWQYGDKYRKDIPQDQKVVRLLPQGEHYIYFSRHAGLKSNEAVLNLVTPVALSGCAKVIPPAVTSRRSGRLLTYTVENTEVVLDKTPRYSQHDCASRGQGGMVSSEIVINRDEIVGNRIQTITLRSGGGGNDVYNVEFSGNTLTLFPRTTKVFKPFAGASRPDPLSFTFHSANTVVLYAPNAPGEADVTEAITKLAQSKGMMPEPGLQNSETLFFNDQSGLLAGSLEYGANAYVGQVVAEETFQGRKGAYKQPKAVDIYARLPGPAD